MQKIKNVETVVAVHTHTHTHTHTSSLVNNKKIRNEKDSNINHTS